jgi:hypothetical protein
VPPYPWKTQEKRTASSRHELAGSGSGEQGSNHSTSQRRRQLLTGKPPTSLPPGRAPAGGRYCKNVARAAMLGRHRPRRHPRAAGAAQVSRVHAQGSSSSEQLRSRRAKASRGCMQAEAVDTSGKGLPRKTVQGEIIAALLACSTESSPSRYTFAMGTSNTERSRAVIAPKRGPAAAPAKCSALRAASRADSRGLAQRSLGEMP